MSRLAFWAAGAALLGALVACGSGDAASAPSGTVDSPPAASPPAPAPVSRWRPALGDTWQWQLAGSLNSRYTVAIYDLDLFDTSATTFRSLRGSGVRVVCYFSAGSGENWRPDYGQFQSSDLGQPLDGWPGERWLDTRSLSVREVMRRRLDLAAAKGCDGVEPDNVDAFINNPGFALTAATQLDFNRFLATEAHARGLAIALKNAVELVAQLEPDFDFAVNEQCHEYDECGVYRAFTTNGKPVLNAEYAPRYRDNTGGARDVLCQAALSAGIRTLVLPRALDDSFRFSCD